MPRSETPSRPSFVVATAAALLVATLGVCECVGSPARERAWQPKVGEDVIYTADGLDTTWKIATVRMVDGGPSMTLIRDDEIMHAGAADVRCPGPLLGF